MPYQCMAKSGNKLVAARGSSIDIFNLQTGSLLSVWKCPASQETKNENGNSKELPITTETSEPMPLKEEINEESGPPAKKRKLSDEPEPNEDPDKKSEQKSGKNEKKAKPNSRSAAVSSGLEAPAVIALAATKDGRHVIAVTGEDKSIRVFESTDEGGVQKLNQISQRIMPKRPCSVTLSLDSTTIVSADKFGDVYSLPLIPSPIQDTQNSTPEPTRAAKPFVPAANELTIHSQRNRRALENQKRQAAQRVEKTEPTFEHKLLLGHVSMLTDVALVAVEGRTYIVTADRDEHIRVSRGIPQAHIIECFCLGHTDFITRLCFLAGRSDLLISGGGDDELYVWEWLSGRLLAKVDLKTHVDGVRSGLSMFEGSEVPAKSVVSGISSVELTIGGEVKDAIVVTCEGVPALFTFLLTGQNTLEHLQTLQLLGNALGLIITSGEQSDATAGLVVSIDTIHKAGSTSEHRESKTDLQSSLQSYKFQEGMLVEGGVAFSPADDVEGESGPPDRLGGLLYNLENLRKREGDNEECKSE
ncbi:WD repeat domain-containing protein [Drepanopeziza brunnea f. sp. 'multigermtubi' MB_m1]|uniref:WD repeat domain-containing protein n=1 Tax=Marssonina brunnea f. sp. multigermtubi (strain MB_m1) TaxID=1072389 RepID=K1XX25_MARBU|nr:WD repeat domain-containing protein [Drepanopeziza brunnea f. sp. 'multigermtubi' MB_m1]EKD17319.1 WD repeat domain-containing protein [Drepanopeziza brunnea f. sp. 'multigermtubi' MB_m1]